MREQSRQWKMLGQVRQSDAFSDRVEYYTPSVEPERRVMSSHAVTSTATASAADDDTEKIPTRLTGGIDVDESPSALSGTAAATDRQPTEWDEEGGGPAMTSAADENSASLQTSTLDRETIVELRRQLLKLVTPEELERLATECNIHLDREYEDDQSQQPEGVVQDVTSQDEDELEQKPEVAADVSAASGLPACRVLHTGNGNMTSDEILSAAATATMMMATSTGEMKSTTFGCPLCPLKGPSKSLVDAHIVTHFPFACSQCQYRSRTAGRLDRHIKQYHDPSQLTDSACADKQRRTRSIFKCRSCPFTSHDQSDYYVHVREHIVPERRLTCPACTFVTEFRHHFKYHVMTHLNAKPYRCVHARCQYRGYNPSMLKSHLLMHTNDYTHQCADCTFRTKQTHMWNIHRLQTGHRQRALNQDGSLTADQNSSPTTDTADLKASHGGASQQQQQPQPTGDAADTRGRQRRKRIHSSSNNNNNNVAVPQQQQQQQQQQDTKHLPVFLQQQNPDHRLPVGFPGHPIAEKQPYPPFFPAQPPPFLQPGFAGWLSWMATAATAAGMGMHPSIWTPPLNPLPPSSSVSLFAAGCLSRTANTTAYNTRPGVKNLQDFSPIVSGIGGGHSMSFCVNGTESSRPLISPEMHFNTPALPRFQPSKFAVSSAQQPAAAAVDGTSPSQQPFSAVGSGRVWPPRAQPQQRQQWISDVINQSPTPSLPYTPLLKPLLQSTPLPENVGKTSADQTSMLGDDQRFRKWKNNPATGTSRPNQFVDFDSGYTAAQGQSTHRLQYQQRQRAALLETHQQTHPSTSNPGTKFQKAQTEEVPMDLSSSRKRTELARNFGGSAERVDDSICGPPSSKIQRLNDNDDRIIIKSEQMDETDRQQQHQQQQQDEEALWFLRRRVDAIEKQFSHQQSTLRQQNVVDEPPVEGSSTSRLIATVVNTGMELPATEPKEVWGCVGGSGNERRWKEWKTSSRPMERQLAEHSASRMEDMETGGEDCLSASSNWGTAVDHQSGRQGFTKCEQPGVEVRLTDVSRKNPAAMEVEDGVASGLKGEMEANNGKWKNPGQAADRRTTDDDLRKASMSAEQLHVPGQTVVEPSERTELQQGSTTDADGGQQNDGKKLGEDVVDGQPKELTPTMYESMTNLKHFIPRRLETEFIHDDDEQVSVGGTTQLHRRVETGSDDVHEPEDDDPDDVTSPERPRDQNNTSTGSNGSASTSGSSTRSDGTTSHWKRRPNVDERSVGSAVNDEAAEPEARRKNPNADVDAKPSYHRCAWCEIEYPDRAIYALHMSYHHSIDEPFRCRRCDQLTRNQFDFYVHISSFPHPN